jgi:hypothetical protein
VFGFPPFSNTVFQVTLPNPRMIHWHQASLVIAEQSFSREHDQIYEFLLFDRKIVAKECDATKLRAWLGWVEAAHFMGK